MGTDLKVEQEKKLAAGVDAAEADQLGVGIFDAFAEIPHGEDLACVATQPSLNLQPLESEITG